MITEMGSLCLVQGQPGLQRETLCVRGKEVQACHPSLMIEAAEAGGLLAKASLGVCFCPQVAHRFLYPT